jgi:hypothetical protein
MLSTETFLKSKLGIYNTCSMFSIFEKTLNRSFEDKRHDIYKIHKANFSY